MKLSQSPLCERCESQGRTRLATLVHHIVPVKINRDLIHTLSNLKALCVDCHPIEEAET